MTRALILLASDARRGAEIEGERLGRELTSAGFTIDVVALTEARGDVARLPVESLGSRPMSTGTLRGLRRRASQHDVVVAYGSSTLPACAIALAAMGTPFVYRSIGDPAAWVRGPLHRQRTGVLMRRATAVVTLWDGGSRAIRDLYGVAPRRISVIPNARSREEFSPADAKLQETARHSWGIDTEVSLCAVIGALAGEKRVGMAIDAVALLPEAHLLIVGDGPERSGLERRARRSLGDKVVFAGPLADVRSVYAASDVLLVPSSTEGMPGVVIEAALSGLPVAACSVGALGWMFDNGVRGALVPPDTDPRRFADAIVEAMSLESDPSALAAVCSWSAVTDRWSQVLAAVAGGPGRAPGAHRR
jgi:glycosyltransferase involved in cell wall biosynthesis